MFAGLPNHSPLLTMNQLNVIKKTIRTIRQAPGNLYTVTMHDHFTSRKKYLLLSSLQNKFREFELSKFKIFFFSNYCQFYLLTAFIIQSPKIIINGSTVLSAAKESLFVSYYYVIISSCIHRWYEFEHFYQCENFASSLITLFGTRLTSIIIHYIVLDSSGLLFIAKGDKKRGITAKNKPFSIKFIVTYTANV